MEEQLTFFKLNAQTPVGVRFHTQDEKGLVLNFNEPYVAIQASKLRDFKRANKVAINNGLIIETKEPDLDFDSPNMIDDEKAATLVKNVIALKNALREITSVTVVEKLLVEAKAQKRPSKTIQIIQKRFAELSGEEDDLEEPNEMRGVS